MLPYTHRQGGKEKLLRTKKPMSFPKALRVLKKNDFKALFSSSRIRTKSFLAFYKKNQGPFPRIGLSIHQSCGSAVYRNRIKRILREFFRQAQDTLAPLDIHLLVRQKETKKDWLSYEKNIFQDMGYVLRKLRSLK